MGKSLYTTRCIQCTLTSLLTSGIVNTTFGSMHLRVCSRVGVLGLRFDLESGAFNCTVDGGEAPCEAATNNTHVRIVSQVCVKLIESGTSLKYLRLYSP